MFYILKTEISQEQMIKIFSYTEKDLIADCRKGKAKAQKALFEQYSPKMLAVCVRYIKDLASAEDVLLLAFMKVFENLDKFEAKGSFEGWIRKIVVNEALGHLRKNTKIQFEESQKADIEAHAHSPTTDLEVQDLLQLLHQLPTGYRTVFSLYAIEGYSHQEIGEMLNITESTSKSQLNRARNMLKNLVEKQTQPLTQWI